MYTEGEKKRERVYQEQNKMKERDYIIIPACTAVARLHSYSTWRQHFSIQQSRYLYESLLVADTPCFH